MRNHLDNCGVAYMVRHFIKTNVSDPLTAEKRGVASGYKQFFSGDGTASQVNYLEFKPVSDTSPMRVHTYAGGVWTLKAETTDYLRSTANQTITWVTTPTSGNDNIRVTYDHVKGWIYDDAPSFTSAFWPRVSVVEQATDVRGPFLGMYNNFTSGCGDLQTKIFVISVFGAEGMEISISNRTYKNADIVEYIAQLIKTAFHSSGRVPPYWKFWDMKVSRMQRNRNYEESGKYAMDLTLEVKYFDKGG